ncbi:hypothetical protein LCGC14_0561160 [marine sediment metagenome]|uniref:Uncharacterized protein n=1 Tax=marine sediment metagenome TaxID=412755 RepID=A0A0F9RLX9_9ZZZZ
MMTERLSGLPPGLLSFAREIRHIRRDQRFHKYIAWLEEFRPRDYQRYIDLHIPRG